MRTNPDPTVFVVDNDPASREAVRALATTMQVRCEAYSSGLDFLDHYDPDRPGCLVLAIRVVDVSGPQIQRRLLARGATTPVIFLAAHTSVPVVVRVMREGALHVLEQPVDEQELWETIQHALRVDAVRRRQCCEEEELRARVLSLSYEESQLLEMVVKGATNRQIAREQQVCVRTVELRRARVMQKMGANSFAELIHITLALNNGDCRCLPHLLHLEEAGSPPEEFLEPGLSLPWPGPRRALSHTPTER